MNAGWLALGEHVHELCQVDGVLCRLCVDVHVGRGVGGEDLPHVLLPEGDHLAQGWAQAWGRDEGERGLRVGRRGLGGRGLGGRVVGMKEIA